MAEKQEEQEQEETAVRDLPVLDLIENQSDGESDNEEDRFLLQQVYITSTAGNRQGRLRETRKDVLWEIERWSTGERERVFWLNGLDGTGTSTIATLRTRDDFPCLPTCLSVSTFLRGAAPGLMFADGEVRCLSAQSYPHSDPHRQRQFESPRVPRPVGLPPEDRRSPTPVLIPLRGKLSHHRVAPAIKSSSRLDNRLRACHAPFVFESQAEWEDYPGDVCRWIREDQLARPSRVPHFAQREESFRWRRPQPGLCPDAHGFCCYPFARSIHHKRFVRCDLSTRAIPLSAQSTLDTLTPLFKLQASSVTPSLLSRSYSNARLNIAAPSSPLPRTCPKATERMVHPMRWIWYLMSPGVMDWLCSWVASASVYRLVEPGIMDSDPHHPRSRGCGF